MCSGGIFKNMYHFLLQAKIGPRTPTEDDESIHTPVTQERGPRTPPGGSGDSDTWKPPRSRESRNRKRKSRSRSPTPKTPTEAPPTSKRHRSSDDDDFFRNTPVSSSSPTQQSSPHMPFGLNTPPFSVSPHPRTPPFSPPTSSATPSDWNQQADQSWDTPFFTRKKKSAKKEEQMEKEAFRHMVRVSSRGVQVTSRL